MPEVIVCRVRSSRYPSERNRSELVAHAPARHHLAGEVGDLLHVVLGAGGPLAIHQLLCGAAAQDTDDAGTQLTFGVVVAVFLGSLVGDAKCQAAWRYADPMHRIRFRYQQTTDRMTALVIRHALPFAGRHEHLPRWAKQDLLKRIYEIRLPHGQLTTSSSEQPPH